MRLRFKRAYLSPQQFLVVGFALIITIGTILLALPDASAKGISIGFLNALFTAASATCVTGLVVLDTGTHFSTFGQVVILMLFQLGGIGFMTTTTWIATVLRKKVTLRERLILKESMNQNKVEGIVRLIRKVVMYSVCIELTAALLFAFRWSLEMPFSKALYYGFFHAISFFNNAGFDLFGEFQSLTPYVNDVFMNVLSVFLILLGGIGFIVMSDLIEYPKTRRLSLHSKVVLATSGILLFLGTVVILICEFTNSRTLGSLDGGNRILASFFQSASLRSSGTSTLDITEMRQATQFFMVVMMFIGAAPGSTGGGIKVTTFAILVVSVITMLRGKEDVVLFRHRLSKNQIYKAITVTLISLMLIVASTMILSTTEGKNFLVILFEVVSAFGTVGFSMGLSQDLSLFGKILFVVLMFAGRLGPVTLAYAIQSKKRKDLYRYPEGKIIIG